MGLFDSLFSKPKAAPTMPTVDYGAAAAQGANYNWGQLAQFQSQAPNSLAVMNNLFNQYSGNTKQAEDTIFRLGSQLANNGQTDLQGDFFKYARRLGLENAAATGAPLSGSFGQSLGASYGARDILGQQLQGANLLQGVAQSQGNRFFNFLQPSLGALNANFVSPQAFMQGAQANNQIQQQNAQIDYLNSNRKSWFNSLLDSTMQSVVGMPFNFTQNAMNVAASSPQIAASAALSYFGGPGAGGSVQQNAPARTAGQGGGGFFSFA